jgi:hypothetical protein
MVDDFADSERLGFPIRRWLKMSLLSKGLEWAGIVVEMNGKTYGDMGMFIGTLCQQSGI